MVHSAGAWQVFTKYGHPHIFKKRGTTHNSGRWCTLQEFHTQTLVKNLSALCFHLCMDFVGNGQ